MATFRRFYIENSMIFITIVTNNRIPILIENIDLLRTSIKNAPYSFKVFAGVVLPDHCHIIIKPENINEYPKIIKSIKYFFSKNINYENKLKNDSENKRKEKGIWQRRYFEHIIRDENDLFRHLDYIHYNPYKHLNIAPKDWNFSSFHKFVNDGFYDLDWCNFENKNNINVLDLE